MSNCVKVKIWCYADVDRAGLCLLSCCRLLHSVWYHYSRLGIHTIKFLQGLKFIVGYQSVT